MRRGSSSRPPPLLANSAQGETDDVQANLSNGDTRIRAHEEGCSSKALSQTSWGEGFQICCCLACVLFTLSSAFFMPEIAIHWANKVEAWLPDEPPQRGKSRDARASSSTLYQYRNDTHRSCAQQCFHTGRGGIVLLPLRYWTKFPPWVDKRRPDLLLSWPLSSIAERETCRDLNRAEVPLNVGEKRFRRLSTEIYVNQPGFPFDGRLLRLNGLVFIAEIRDPSEKEESDEGEASTKLDIGARRTSRGSSKLASNRMEIPFGSSNFYLRTVANAPRGRHVDTSLPTMRRAKRVLSSFDLLLVGKWERDPIQRRALLSLLRGPQTEGTGTIDVKSLSDAEVAAELGFVEYDPSLDVSVIGPPLSSRPAREKKRENDEITAAEKKQLQFEFDRRLFAHAANMSMSAIRLGSSQYRPQVICLPDSHRRSCLIQKNRRPSYLTQRLMDWKCVPLLK